MMMTPGASGSRGGVAMATKRIKKEIADLSKENLGGISLTPNESNIFLWTARLPGPAGSPYEGGEFEVQINIPQDYPFSPPRLQFMTRVYHCNIASTGAICLDLLKSAWSPALSLYKVILSLSSLLTDPNPSDPLVPAIAQEYNRNRKKHDETAREWVKMYAQPKKAPPQPVITKPAAPAARAAPAPRAIPRPSTSASTSGSASGSNGPPAQLAGTRRSHAQTRSSARIASGPIDLVGGDDEVEDVADSSDVEVLGESARMSNGQPAPGSSAGANGLAEGSGRGGRDKPGARSTKRARRDDEGRNNGGGSGRGGGGGGDDVIVIDD